MLLVLKPIMLTVLFYLASFDQSKRDMRQSRERDKSLTRYGAKYSIMDQVKFVEDSL